jgi:hypothetical protein
MKSNAGGKGNARISGGESDGDEISGNRINDNRINDNRMSEWYPHSQPAPPPAENRGRRRKNNPCVG